jgi:hypothetical protein
MMILILIIFTYSRSDNKIKLSMSEKIPTKTQWITKLGKISIVIHNVMTKSIITMST